MESYLEKDMEVKGYVYVDRYDLRKEQQQKSGDVETCKKQSPGRNKRGQGLVQTEELAPENRAPSSV